MLGITPDVSPERAERLPRLSTKSQFSTGKTSRKAKNLAADPRCVVCPEGAEEALVVEGVAADLAGEAARARFFAAYEAKYGIDVSTMGEPLYVVRPRTVFGQIEKTFTKSATRWQFGAG